MAGHRHPLHVAADHPAFEGHFPGDPVWPGVALLAEVIELARRQPEWAALVASAGLRLGVAKFLAPVRPGARLEVDLTDTRGGLKFEVWNGSQLAASGQLDTGSGAPAATP